MNTDIQNICKNYKNIVECEFLDDDVFSVKLVDYYKEFITKSDLNNPDAIQKARNLDEALFKYVNVEDYSFSRRLKDTIDISAVVSENFSYVNEFLEYIIAFASEYDNTKNNVIVQTKWL
jgi:hypothetical protein